MNRSKQYLFYTLLVFFTANFLFGQTSSISLDGTNTSYATVTNNSALEFSTGTIEFWVYPENYSGAGAIIAMRDVNGTRFSIHLDVQNSTIGLWDGTNYRTLPSNLIAQNWVHLAFVFKAATTDVYRNGVFLGTLSNTVNTAITGKVLTLGQNGQAGEYFTGKIDELRIWNDERTVDEISTYEFQELGGLEENLVAYYNFDEGSGTTAANKVGNAVASVGFQSGAAWGSNSAGVDPVLAKAVYFNVDRFMTVPNNAALETNDQTIEFWVKPVYVSSSYSPAILAMRDVNGTRFSIHMAGDRGSIGVWNGTDYYSVIHSFTNETWYHIAVVMNSNTSSTEFFVNGASVGTQNFTHSNVTGKDLTIAQNGEGGEQFFGEIDELRIWNDLRTAQEISDNYQKELNGQQSNLAAYFRFNEGSGVSTRNWVQNGVGNGTFQNSSYWTDHDFIVTITETTASQPSGSGLQSDPYLISNLAELRWVSENSSSWSSYFEQTADIDASETSSWNSNAGFSPIGNNLKNFTGNYDGKGKTINGITIVAGLTSSDSYKGFFGSLLNATVKNLKLTNINITGGYLNVGGLVGHLSFSQILNCGVEGDINNAFSSTGLVFGSAVNNSVILECYAKGNVTAKIYGGIFCGVVQTSSSITNSYAVGTVKRVDATFIYFGLFAGKANSSTISKCFTKGNIFDSNGTTVFRTDAGFIGSFNSNIITDCFFDSLASNQKSDVFVVAKTTSEMKTAATFIDADWDFEVETTNGSNNYWDIDQSGSYNDGYPFLAWENGTTVLYDPTQPSGSGAEGDPYLIANLDNLKWISENSSSWSSYFEQTADIDASATSTWNGGTGFSPIGDNTTNFTGQYDGKNHKIDGLTINRNADYLGLFGKLQNAKLTNIGVTNVYIITSNSYVGGLAGWFQGNSQPGIEISNCYSTGTIYGGNGSNYVGGLAGYNDQFVKSSYSKTNITNGGVYVGGLIGYSYGDVSNCYSTGSVTAAGIHGGLIGESGSGAIDTCYSISKTSNGNGGITAVLDPGNGCEINASFWNTDSTAHNYIGYGIGKTSAEMKLASTFTDAGWDMAGNVWKIDGSGIINGGYPFLAWESNSGEALPVELTSFTASSASSTARESSVILQWKTATEVDNYGFEIERRNSDSEKSSEWTKIGFVQGAGNSNSPKEYKFTDNSKVDGLSRSYRLKQIDQEGQFSYSKEVEVTLELPGKYELMQNYPNPFNPSTTIRFNLPENANVKLVIYNILGEQVSTLFDKEFEAGFHKETFNAAGLASGVYVYMLHAKSAANSGKEFSDVKKMILLR